MEQLKMGTILALISDLKSSLRAENVEGTLSDLAYQIEYFFDVDGIQSEDVESQFPCDSGECPYNAQGGYDCRNYCGLGVDEDEPSEDENCPFGGDVANDCADCAYYCDYHYVNGECREREEYIPSSTNGDYSPSNPWEAPGMSVKDFI